MWRSRKKNVATVNPLTQPTMTRRRPKRATSQPVMGVATAVARMLKVITQEISSAVADKAPWICGSTVEAMRIVVK